MRLGTRLLFEGITPQGARTKLAYFCSAPLAGFCAAVDIARAKALLRGPDSLIEVALACGFASQSHFTRAFKAATDTTPTTWRSAGQER
ncbi:helix-turn-helix domain-containing protein [Sagittula sp. NFXS13]|uniref:helix-turn-helix domain-containing protein n=1 Tax=Sagittula sp. NFXS13 TaxID=2819095 RepID=UPI0032DE8D75